MQSAQALAKTGDAQTQTSFSSEKLQVFPLLDSKAFDKNPKSIETACFNSSRQNLFNFQDASNESNKMAKIDTNMKKKSSKSLLMPSIAELKI